MIHDGNIIKYIFFSFLISFDFFLQCRLSEVLLCYEI